MTKPQTDQPIVGTDAAQSDYRLENDPRFLQRIERARKSVRAGRGVRLEDI
jgi:hypothetical protein